MFGRSFIYRIMFLSGKFASKCSLLLRKFFKFFQSSAWGSDVTLWGLVNCARCRPVSSGRFNFDALPATMGVHAQYLQRYLDDRSMSARSSRITFPCASFKAWRQIFGTAYPMKSLEWHGWSLSIFLIGYRQGDQSISVFDCWSLRWMLFVNKILCHKVNEVKPWNPYIELNYSDANK